MHADVYEQTGFFMTVLHKQVHSAVAITIINTITDPNTPLQTSQYETTAETQAIKHSY